jgi:hypothetical protein
MIGLNLNMTILTLNINEFVIQIKRQRLSKLFKKWHDCMQSILTSYINQKWIKGKKDRRKTLIKNKQILNGIIYNRESTLYIKNKQTKDKEDYYMKIKWLM